MRERKAGRQPASTNEARCDSNEGSVEEGEEEEDAEDDGAHRLAANRWRQRGKQGNG